MDEEFEFYFDCLLTPGLSNAIQWHVAYSQTVFANPQIRHHATIANETGCQYQPGDCR